MGTSKGYGMPVGGDWTPLKKAATSFVNTKGQDLASVGNLLNSYLKANGGVQAFVRGQAGSQQSSRTGSQQGSGTAGRKTGQNLGGFLASVGDLGLDKALREAGLSDLIGKSATEVSTGLLDFLAGPANTLDEQAARSALTKINDELLKDTQTYDDVDKAFSKSLDKDRIERIVTTFFGYYLYELFCRDFYEQWVKKVGTDQANQSLYSVKDCIEWSLKSKLTNKDVAKIDWYGQQGQKLIQQIMQETLAIFEVLP